MHYGIMGTQEISEPSEEAPCPKRDTPVRRAARDLHEGLAFQGQRVAAHEAREGGDAEDGHGETERGARTPGGPNLSTGTLPIVADRQKRLENGPGLRFITDGPSQTAHNRRMAAFTGRTDAIGWNTWKGRNVRNEAGPPASSAGFRGRRHHQPESTGPPAPSDG